MKRTKSSDGVMNRDMIYGLGTPINDELNISRKERSKSYSIGLKKDKAKRKKPKKSRHKRIKRRKKKEQQKRKIIQYNNKKKKKTRNIE